MDFAAYEARLEARESALATLCVHAGEEPTTSGALDPPIVMSSAFAFDERRARGAARFAAKNDAYIYGRWGNPTVEALEAKLAALEGAEAACATASGMAAIAGVAPRDLRGRRSRRRAAIDVRRERAPPARAAAEARHHDDVRRRRRPRRTPRRCTTETRVLYVETPSNPTLGVVDIAGIVDARARARGHPSSIVDDTFATPFAQTPLALGADLVVHSMTKGIGGHGDVIGGVVLRLARARRRARATRS